MKFAREMKRVVASAAVSLIMASTPGIATEVLHTGADETYAPLVFRNLDGKLEGFSIDLGHALEQELGYTIEVEGTQFSALIPALNSKKYDFILGAVTATPERAEAMLFSEAYLDSDYLLVQKKSADSITAVEQMKGKKLAVNRGSPYEQWARENNEKYGFEYSVYPTNADAIQAVISGRADANMAGVPAQAWAAKHNPLLKTTFEIKTGQVWAFAFRKDDTARRNEISNALKCLKQKGAVAKIAVKWLGFEPEATKKIFPGQGIPDMPGYDPTPVTLSCK